MGHGDRPGGATATRTRPHHCRLVLSTRGTLCRRLSRLALRSLSVKGICACVASWLAVRRTVQLDRSWCEPTGMPIAKTPMPGEVRPPANLSDGSRTGDEQACKAHHVATHHSTIGAGGETSILRRPPGPPPTPRRRSRMSPDSVACGGVPFLVLRSSRSIATSSLLVDRSRSSRLETATSSPAHGSQETRSGTRRSLSNAALASAQARSAGGAEAEDLLRGSMVFFHIHSVSQWGSLVGAGQASGEGWGGAYCLDLGRFCWSHRPRSRGAHDAMNIHLTCRVVCTTQATYTLSLHTPSSHSGVTGLRCARRLALHLRGLSVLSLLPYMVHCPCRVHSRAALRASPPCAVRHATRHTLSA